MAILQGYNKVQGYRKTIPIDYETCLICNNWNQEDMLGCFDIEDGSYYCTIFKKDNEEEVEILNLEGFLEDYRINLPSTKGAIEFVEISLGKREEFSIEISEEIGYYGTI